MATESEMRKASLQPETLQPSDRNADFDDHLLTQRFDGIWFDEEGDTPLITKREQSKEVDVQDARLVAAIEGEKRAASELMMSADQNPKIWKGEDFTGLAKEATEIATSFVGVKAESDRMQENP